MKALTLIQPWATLVAIGAKKIETRNWKTSYRGPLAIHASKGFPTEARRFTADPLCYEAVKTHRGCVTFPDLSEAYPLGVVIATCNLVGIVSTDRYCFNINGLLHDDNLHTFEMTDQEREFGDYSPGRFAWILRDVTQLPHPIPAKGALGLWEWVNE